LIDIRINEDLYPNTTIKETIKLIGKNFKTTSLTYIDKIGDCIEADFKDKKSMIAFIIKNKFKYDFNIQVYVKK